MTKRLGMKIDIKILNKEFYTQESNGLPRYQTDGSAALDLVCTEDATIYPGETKMIPTGLAVWIGSNTGIAGLILPRSGLGTKGLVLANTIGLIDEDYQGELIISAWNRNEVITGQHMNYLKWNHEQIINLKAGDRIAQLMFIPVIKTEWNIVEDFNDNTQRGSSGFGSTGIGG